MLIQFSSCHSAVVHHDVSCSQDKLQALPLNAYMYRDRETDMIFILDDVEERTEIFF